MTALLWHNKHRRPLTTAVQLALREFQHAQHTRGKVAQLCQLNPHQMPAERTLHLHGLPLAADPQVPLDHLRICAGEADG